MSDVAYDLSALKVLVVDDNRHMRLLLRSLLAAFGLKQVNESDSVERAYKLYLQWQPDIVITDLHMEPENGLSLVRKIRLDEDSSNPYVPIIVLSGHSEAERVAQARDAGINEFLTKPISAQSLYRRIQSVIENSRPFVRTDAYFGPDRRRHNFGPPEGMDERRVSTEEDIVELDADDDSPD